MKEIKLSELKNTFNVINKYEGSISCGSFVVPYNQSKPVNPLTSSEKFLNSLDILYKRGDIDFEFDVEIEGKAKGLNDDIDIKNDQVIFNPKDKLIKVETIETTPKAINVGKTELDKIEESQAFLSQHWKTIERDLPSLPREEVFQHLRVAKLEEMTGKKVDLLEERLSQLS